MSNIFPRFNFYHKPLNDIAEYIIGKITWDQQIIKINSFIVLFSSHSGIRFICHKMSAWYVLVHHHFVCCHQLWVFPARGLVVFSKILVGKCCFWILEQCIRWCAFLYYSIYCFLHQQNYVRQSTSRTSVRSSVLLPVRRTPEGWIFNQHLT